MRGVLLVLALVGFHCWAAAQSVGTFKIRRGNEVKSSTRNVKRDTVPSYWYFGGTLNGCADLGSSAFTRYAVKLGFSSPYQMRNPETSTRYYMLELGLMAYDSRKWAQRIGFNASMSLPNSFYGVEFYAMKRVVRLKNNVDFVSLGLGADMLSREGYAAYGLKPYLEFKSPDCIDLNNLQLTFGYRFFLNQNWATPKNSFFYGFNWVYPIFGR